MPSSGGDILESPTDPIARFDGRDVGGLVQSQERATTRTEFTAGRPLLSGVGADTHPTADRQRFKRRSGQTVATIGRNDPIVDHLHSRQRRSHQINPDCCAERSGQPPGGIEHVNETFPPVSRTNLRRVELRGTFGRRTPDPFRHEPGDLLAEHRDQLRPVSRAPQTQRCVGERALRIGGLRQATSNRCSGYLHHGGGELVHPLRSSERVGYVQRCQRTGGRSPSKLLDREHLTPLPPLDTCPGRPIAADERIRLDATRRDRYPHREAMLTGPNRAPASILAGRDQSPRLCTSRRTIDPVRKQQRLIPRSEVEPLVRANHRTLPRVGRRQSARRPNDRGERPCR